MTTTLPSKRAAEAAAKLQAFLQSPDLATVVYRPKPVAVTDAAKATALLLDILVHTVPAPGFDPGCQARFDTLRVFGGAVLWGRMTSLATRLATLKHADQETDCHAIVDPATWASLFDDDVYFRGLAVDVTRQTLIVWDAASEAVAFARGARAFFSGSLTTGDVFVADLTCARERVTPTSQEDRAAFDGAAHFGVALRSEGTQASAIMKIALDKSQEKALAALVRDHLRAHLFAASAWLGAAAIERRIAPRPPKRPRTAAMASLLVDVTARAATESLAPNVGIVYAPPNDEAVLTVTMFKETALTNVVMHKFEENKRLLNEALQTASATDAPPPSGRSVAGLDAVYVDNDLSADDLMSPDDKFGLMRLVFREARRNMTLTYLLGGEPALLVGSDSALGVMNAGRDNVTMKLQTAESDKYNSKTHPNQDGVKMTDEDIRMFARSFDVLEDIRASDTRRVDATILRLPKEFAGGGFETPENASRVLAQYLHASTYNVGPKVGGVYCFKKEDFFDDLELQRWNFLYTQATALSPVQRSLVAQFRDYVYAQPESTPNRLEWLFELTRPDSDPLTSPGPALPAYNAVFEDLLSAKDWRRRVQDPLALLNTDAQRAVYQAIHVYRLMRRADHEADPRVSSEPDNQAWFLDACGVTLENSRVRRARCGAAASKILVAGKKRPKVDGSDTLKIWGLMFVVERMTIEFGKDGYAPEGSILALTYAKAKDTNGLNGISVAKSQFDGVEKQLDEVWKLLARMSSVGILNCDAHLGNYMLSAYVRESYKAKIIDFDPRLTFLLSRNDLKGDWKPLYVLNTLLVLFTLAGDPSRIRLYDIFKNAQRPEKTAIFAPGQVHAVGSLRLSQFQDVVVDVAAELARTRPEDQSLVQKLLALRWGGGFKGAATFSNSRVKGALKLPTAVFVSPDPQTLLYRGKFKEKVTEPEFQPLSDYELKEAADVFDAIRSDVRISGSVPPTSATLADRVEWSLRHNLAWRGVNEQLQLVHHEWTTRQLVVYRALQRRYVQGGAAVPFTGERIPADVLLDLTSVMTPGDLQNFNDRTKFFKGTQQLVSAPLLYHLQTPRDANYNLLNMLSDYVFAPSLNRDVGNARNTAPRFPPKEAQGRDVQAWPRWMTEEDRAILQLPPVGPVETAVAAPAAAVAAA